MTFPDIAFALFILALSMFALWEAT